jgi:hypothetical protein
LVNTWEALLELVKEAASVSAAASDELVECIADNVPYTLDPD